MKLDNSAARVQNSRLFKLLQEHFITSWRESCVAFFSEFEKKKIIFDQKKNPERSQKEAKKVGSKRSRKSGKICSFKVRNS